MARSLRRIVSVSKLALCLGLVICESSAGGTVPDFEKDVRPVLEKNCYECHGGGKSKAGLRLDRKADALKGGDIGPLLVPGNSAESLLIQVIEGTHDEISRMPKKREPLSTDHIAALRAWIDQGAAWPDTAEAKRPGADHWAFKPPIRPPVPVVKNTRWPRNAVDAFVLANLEKENLKPSAEADRITLLRRLSLDLVGLPPTIAEVDAFLTDKSPDAYAKQVERLLASPHYGERWAAGWLDAARYADSDGFEKDKPRWVWAYRDWVINAFNRNLPYDRFIIEQIAGDLLPDAAQDQIVATGFLRNSMVNEEGGIDPEQFRMEAMFDRMDAIGKGVLGLTIQCAQCHDHKFDPITQKEYYRLFAFINNSDEGSVTVHTLDEQIKRAGLLTRVRELETGLCRTTPDWEARMARWESEVRTNQPEWICLDLENAGDNAQRHYKQPDGSLLALGYAPTKYYGKYTNVVHLPEIRAFRLEAFTDPNLPAGGPGRSFKGLFALSEFMVEAADSNNLSNKFEVKFVRATADFANETMPLEPLFDDKSGGNRVTGPVSLAIDGDETTAWGIDAGPGRRNTDRVAVFEANTNIAFSSGTYLQVRLRQLHGGWNSDDNQNQNLGRFRISVCASSNVVADTVPKKVREILAIPTDRRTPAQAAAVFSHWRTTVPEWEDVNAKIDALWKEHPEGVTQLVMHERADARGTHLLKRGDWLKPDEAINAGVPEFLHPLPTNCMPDRLTFARWLVDAKSPTTARALVNRVWQSYFGSGLQTTPEDFGTRCELPSHPELLDWLACEFMQPTSAQLSTPNSQPTARWSIKHLHRLIVNSATYRQSSRVTPKLYEQDPYNRLLARGPRFRVDGEIVRDIALTASGLLNPALGGRSIYAPAPEFLFQPPTSYGPKTWKEERGPERYRRGLYVFKFRSIPYPMLQTFDAPNGEFSCVRRLRSNSPLQALVSLNETQFVECAQALARRTLADGGRSDAERINYAFRCTLSRPPTDAERRELLAVLEKGRRHIADGWVSATELATGKDSAPQNLPPGTTPTQLAAYTIVSRVLLNLDETITKE